MIDRLDHRRMGDGPTDARRRPGHVLLLLVLALVVVAGCESYVEGGRPGDGGKAPGGLATPRAERASWPDPPKDAVPVRVQRVTDGDTFVATVEGRREGIRIIGVDTPEWGDPPPAGRAVRRGGLQLRQALSGWRHGAPGRGRRAAGPVWADARLR